MTAQIAHKFENRMPSLDCSELMLYDVFTANSLTWENFDRKSMQYSLPHNKPADLPLTSCLWSQYVDRFVLNHDGTLDHVGYSYYLNDDNWIDHDGIERVIGDFYLDMREYFDCGKITCVPFRNGKIVTDRNQWETVQPPWLDQIGG